MVQRLPAASRPQRARDRSMVLVPGAESQMGSVAFYTEESPVVEVVVPDVLWLMHPVTNAEFAAFVESTGHVSVAELRPDPADFPGADPELLVPGSQLFTPTEGPVPLDDWTQWWRWCPGASWRAPEGPGSDWRDVAQHPVVHVGWEDAAAYAAWAGLELPSEPEFEHAARGGLEGADFAWGDELHPGGAVLANTWHGDFPWRSDDARGHDRSSPVAAYPANGYGLFDMVGNVWEWTRTRWTPTHLRAGEELPAAPAATSCCGGPVRPQLAEGDRMVTKGGSHLCSPQYCRRYRPAARQGHGIRDTTSHLGFRCVFRP
jgi:sulfatase modifying factor 1